jgi:hypothetical protein
MSLNNLTRVKKIPARPSNPYDPVYRTRPRAVIVKSYAVELMNGLMEIYDQPEDRAGLDQAVQEEIKRGSKLASWESSRSSPLDGRSATVWNSPCRTGRDRFKACTGPSSRTSYELIRQKTRDCHCPGRVF